MNKDKDLTKSKLGSKNGDDGELDKSGNTKNKVSRNYKELRRLNRD